MPDKHDLRFFFAGLLVALVPACDTEPARLSGPGYPGAGAGYQPMPAGSIMRCFYDEGDGDTPAATIEHVLEVTQGVDAVHVRLTLDPRFVDNTYGANAIGWGARGHTYKQLDGSDRAELRFYDASGALALDIFMDYVTDHVTRGIDGGDGKIVMGDPRYVLAIDTSLSQNFNARGYVAYGADSPATDATYTPNPAAPDWDYRVVYEAWIDVAAFGAAGFGRADVEYIHASPSKLEDDTVVVEPDPCPPDWDPPGDCNDPDGCDHGGCQGDDDCASGEVCDEAGVCVPDVD